MAKISIDQIASWRKGEVITERKFQEVFNLIGKVINMSDDEFQNLLTEIHRYQIPQRWLGEVPTFSDIETFVNDHVNDPEFQPPNKPLPSHGDLILVRDNKDDPDGGKGGVHLYICVYNKVDRVPIWKPYLPFDIIENLVITKAKTILDPIDGKYKSINDFSVEYFGGAPTEAILRWIAKNNQTFSLTDNYSKGEFTLYVNPDTKVGLTVISKVDNNVGNLPPKIPNSENNFWYSLSNAPVPIDEIVDTLKPFVSQEIAKQLPDAINNFTNDNPAFSKDLILLVNGDGGVEHFKTTYGVKDANIDVSDFAIGEQIWEDVPYVVTTDALISLANSVKEYTKLIWYGSFTAKDDVDAVEVTFDMYYDLNDDVLRDGLLLGPAIYSKTNRDIIYRYAMAPGNVLLTKEDLSTPDADKPVRFVLSKIHVRGVRK